MLIKTSKFNIPCSIFIILFWILPLQAHLNPDRFITYTPFLYDSASSEKVALINSMAGYGTFGRYSLVKDDDHEWYQQLAGFVELVRIHDKYSLAFQAGIEHIANPYNNITFRPRTMIWNEGFLFSIRTAKAVWQINYIHRCRHDLENLHEKTERSAIFGSLQSKVLFPVNLSSERTEALVDIKMDLYTFRQDYRYPSVHRNVLPRLNQLIGGFGAKAFLRRMFRNQKAGLYTVMMGKANVYSENDGFVDRFSAFQTIKFTSGLGTGICIIGRAVMRLGVRYEYISDTIANVEPRDSHLVSFGIEILDGNKMR
jgi:hypothetical protein